MSRVTLLRWLLALGVAAGLAGCGGGGSGASPATTPPGSSTGADGNAGVSTPAIAGANVLPVQVDRGTNGATINVPYVTITVCMPGGTACQDIDHIIVDTGSTGLRIAASAVASLQLPAQNDEAGNPVGQCAHFASGFAWGSVRRADVRLAGATAASVPVQLMGDPAASFATVPTECSATGASIGSQGARGILGVSLFDQDCGRACEMSAAPQVYFSCPSAGCTSTRLPMASQVRNPVAALPADNNGVVLVLPPVPPGGSTSASGSLILGIGTQANNQLGGATVYTTDAQGFFTTTYKGSTFTGFLDSGSNGIFFSDASIPRCGDFYCPASPLALGATNTSAGGISTTVSFTLDSINQLVPGAAAANIGGDEAPGRTFDWGLPFFYGRTVFVARSGMGTPAGPGPYWAW